MAYKDLVEEILEKMWVEKKNIAGLTHCITRLRFNLKDESIADTGALKKNERCSYSSTKWWTISSSHRKPRTRSLSRVY